MRHPDMPGCRLPPAVSDITSPSIHSQLRLCGDAVAQWESLSRDLFLPSRRSSLQVATTESRISRLQPLEDKPASLLRLMSRYKLLRIPTSSLERRAHREQATLLFAPSPKRHCPVMRAISNPPMLRSGLLILTVIYSRFVSL